MSAPDDGAGGASASLAGRLRRLRTRAFASEIEFARALGWSQSKVSRLETAKALPSRSDLETWVDTSTTCVTTSRHGLVEELWTVRERARVERSTTAPVSDSTRSELDRYTKISGRATASKRIREFEIGTFPLVLQTHEFLVERLGEAAATMPAYFDDRVVEAITRMRVRDQDLLYDPNKSVQLIIAEGLLYTAPGPATAAQLERVVEITTAVSSTLDFRVLPQDVPHPAPALGAFTIYDDAVFIPALGGGLWLTEADVLETYTALMDELGRRSAGGADAVELVQHARRRLP